MLVILRRFWGIFSRLQCNIGVASGTFAFVNILPGMLVMSWWQLACHCLHLRYRVPSWGKECLVFTFLAIRVFC